MPVASAPIDLARNASMNAIGVTDVPQLGDPVEIVGVGDVVLDELLDDVSSVHFGH